MKENDQKQNQDETYSSLEHLDMLLFQIDTKDLSDILNQVKYKNELLREKLKSIKGKK